MSTRYAITAICFFPEQVELTVKALEAVEACVGIQVTELGPGDSLAKMSDVKTILRGMLDELRRHGYGE